MAIDGYKRKRPDVDWWLAQIEAGERKRKRETYQAHHDRWRRFYKGEYDQEFGHIMPVNLFFMLLRTIVPRVYFRNPSVTISPGKPGFDTLLLAKGLENIDNKLIRNMNVKKHMKKNIQRAFLFGTGVGKLGYGGLYGREIPFIRGLENVEYQGVEDNMPWYRSVPLRNIVLPVEATDWEDARWYAEYIERPLTDVQNDPRLLNPKDVKPAPKDGPKERLGTDGKYETKIAVIWEVHDRKTGKVFLITPYHKKPEGRLLLYDDDIMQLYNGATYFPIVFNENDDIPWGVPDSKNLEPYQLEINETRTQIAKHRRETLVKIIAQRGKISEQEAEKMVSEDASPVIWCTGDVNRGAKVVQTSSIPKEFFLNIDLTMQDVRETIGFSRNQMGEFASRSGDTTATEANIVRMASEIRVDERKDIIADSLSDIVRNMHSIIFDNWGQKEVVEMVGPGGIPIWVELSRDILSKGRWNVKVDPDTGVPETRALRERRAQELYQILKENPLIDPIKLTQYLLYELRGSSFDDMMKMLPTPETMPNGPVSMSEFANMVQGGMREVSGSVGSLERLFGAAPGNSPQLTRDRGGGDV